MADEEDDDLDLAPADAGSLFRAEMAATNFLLGYWKLLVGIVVVGLALILFYGQWQGLQMAQQRGVAAKIASVEARIDAPIIQLAQARDAGQIDDVQITKAARDLVEIAREAKGTARVEASLKAAEMFRVVGADDERRAALEDAVPHAKGVLAYAAQGALANLEQEQGNGDAAIARWRSLIASEEGFLAEQAMLELGLSLEALGRVDEARQVYADFMVKFPNSLRLEKAQQRSDRLGSNG